MAPFLKKSVLPPIPLEEQTPAVRMLVAIIEQQQSTIEQLQGTVQQQLERIEVLETEVARLKKLPKKPKLRPSTLPKDDDESDHDDTDDSDSGQGGDNPTGKFSKPRRLVCLVRNYPEISGIDSLIQMAII